MRPARMVLALVIGLTVWVKPAVGMVQASADAFFGPAGLFPPNELSDEAGGELRVFLIIAGPGGGIVSSFGHSALWIHNAELRTDRAYSYGASRPGFLYPRLLEGATAAVATDTDPFAMLENLRELNRSVVIQELNLSPAQRVAVRDFMEWQIRPDNRVFRYDFYRYNCTTLIRDAVDRAVGGQIRDATVGIGTTSTFRDLTRRYTAQHPLWHAGIMLGLSRWVDRPISVWEEMFLPETLRQRFERLTIESADGRTIPLVASEVTWVGAPILPPPSQRPWLWPLVVGTLVCVALLLTSSNGLRLGFAVLAGAWILVSGAIGTMLAILWGFTDQYLSYGNQNLFVVHPGILLAGAFVIPAILGLHTAYKVTRGLVGMIAGVAVLGTLTHFFVEPRQANAAVMMLFLPPHVGLAWGFFCWSARAREDPFLATNRDLVRSAVIRWTHRLITTGKLLAALAVFAFAGGLIGFLLRPSVPSMGEKLPLSLVFHFHRVTGNMAVLGDVARVSFRLVLLGGILAALVGLLVLRARARRRREDAVVDSGRAGIRASSALSGG